MSQTLNQLADLTAEQRALLMMRLQKKAVDKTPSVKPVPRNGSMPLSYGQQRLWFLQQLEPESAAYNIRVAVRLRGPLNVTALKQSLTEIVRRHESLRTRFVVVDSEPVQIFSAAEPVQLLVTDLSNLAAADRETEAHAQAKRESQKPFDLATDQLFRIQLLKLGPIEHVLLLTQHHIISDGWSLGVMFKELSALYEAYTRGALSPLPELEVQYADYAVWQIESLREEVLSEQLNYWKQQLHGAPSLLELPADHTRGVVASHEGRRQRVELSAELTLALKDLSRREDVTLFMTLLAAFQLLLSRWSGAEDVVVGTPVAGRNRIEVENLIGFFLNTLPLRTQLSGNQTFRELLQQVKKVCLDAYANQDVPFERLVDELQLERKRSYAPLVQVMFSLRNLEDERLSLKEIESSPLGNAEPPAKFTLVLNTSINHNRLVLNFIFDNDLLEPSTVARMSAHFEQLLTSVVSDPDRQANNLAWLPAAERDQVLVKWNETKTGFDTELSIHQIIEQQAARTPEAVAVVYQDESLNYAELNTRANQLAHYVSAQGVGLEDVVGILLERSIDMVVCLLATLKAGAAYLPLDPAYPAGRLQLMLSDAGARIVLTTSELSRSLEVGCRVIELDHERDAIAQESEVNPARRIEADNLAYVIYTSGSTGRPKAAMNTHGAIHNRLLWMQQQYQLGPDDCVLQKTPYSFDVSVWEFFWPLMFGAKLAVARPGGHKDPVY